MVKRYLGCGADIRGRECLVLDRKNKLLAHFDDRGAIYPVYRPVKHGWHECGTGLCEDGKSTIRRAYCRACGVKLGFIW